jgi:N-acetylglutamate synthase-like GNAT family acetyltransferase
MIIRKALAGEGARVAALAASLGLEYSGIEADPAWVAEEEGLILGSVSLMTHPDSLELVALGVEPARRGRGLGRRLVRALLDETDGDIFLATVIPEFFAGCGFVRADAVPAGMAKDAVWCEGCDKSLCAVMVRRRR